jgi:hypothetical protein
MMKFIEAFVDAVCFSVFEADDIAEGEMRQHGRNKVASD